MRYNPERDEDIAPRVQKMKNQRRRLDDDRGRPDHRRDRKEKRRFKEFVQEGR